jgi:hypothetical protein
MILEFAKVIHFKLPAKFYYENSLLKRRGSRGAARKRKAHEGCNANTKTRSASTKAAELHEIADANEGMRGMHESNIAARKARNVER